MLNRELGDLSACPGGSCGMWVKIDTSKEHNKMLVHYIMCLFMHLFNHYFCARLSSGYWGNIAYISGEKMPSKINN